MRLMRKCVESEGLRTHLSLQLALYVMARITVALWLHAKVMLEELSIRSEQLVQLLSRPHIERPFLLNCALTRWERVGILGTVEAALRAPEVPRHIRDDVLRHQLERRLVARTAREELVELYCRGE